MAQRLQQQHCIDTLAATVDQLVSRLEASTRQGPSAPAFVPNTQLPAPSRYAGDSKTCRGFLNQCQHVRQVLQALRANRLYAKLEKCVFEAESLPFLGYIISATGFCMDPEKLSGQQASESKRGKQEEEEEEEEGEEQQIPTVQAQRQARQQPRQKPSTGTHWGNTTSLNCLDWSLLPPSTEKLIRDASMVKGRFIGDPSYEYDFTDIQKTGEEEESQEEGYMKPIKEEARLVGTIGRIDKEVAVIPRGALIKDPHGKILVNRSFQGLAVTEAKKLSNYFHFSDSLTLQTRTLIEKADLDPAMDFLTSLETDIPRGSWCIQFERGNSILVLRSLLWPGLTFYHIPMTPHHGFIYVGNGQRNIDLPFML
ncbi:radial spoke head protein 9 homolog [Rhinatrema bivittatum]|uniref:radial spoke head protein 9 homolog n=1 Tax=Rhinatrema bivittatum TaxID=194408 RepID=UPI00112C6D98|nr:radial spoke head protein 9 homolog [Rhinatrema bivittatum]